MTLVSIAHLNLGEDTWPFGAAKKHKKIPAIDGSSFHVAEDERIYAIGDLHGRLDLLDALLAKITADTETRPLGRRARLIFLGDYIDRGDQSSGILTRLLELRAENDETVEFLMGNHEAAALKFLRDPLEGRDWLKWGGLQTLASYNVAPPSLTSGDTDLIAARDALFHAMQGHVEFLESLDRYAVSGSVVFAHAALDPSLSLSDQLDAALLWGKVARKAESGIAGYKLVHGHFASPNPIILAHRICIDTGAYYSGILTALRLDEEVTFINVGVDTF